MRSLKLVYHNDPGHGWLGVKSKLLLELGIADRISHCSYLRGKTAYLEEDCDADVFINAAKEEGWEVKIVTNRSDSRSPIRSYPCYDVAAI